MNSEAQYTIIDGIKCYNPESASSCDTYLDEYISLTDRIVDESFWVRSRNRLFSQLIIRYCTKYQSKKLFEIGCATGDFLRYLAPKMPSLELTGSELYVQGLVHARQHSPQIEFIQLDATVIPFQEAFDAIAAFDVIEHLDDDESVLAGIYDALKVDGLLFLSVPQHQFLWSHVDELVKHKRRYSKQDLHLKLARNGFQIHFMTSFVFMLFPAIVAQRVLANIKSGSNEDRPPPLEHYVRLNPVLNFIFDKFMKIDEFLIQRNVALPFGGTLIAVAHKTAP